MNRKSKKLLSLALAGALSFSTLSSINSTSATLNNHQLINAGVYINDPQKLLELSLVNKKFRDTIIPTIQINTFTLTEQNKETVKKLLDSGILKNVKTLRIKYLGEKSLWQNLLDNTAVENKPKIERWQYCSDSFAISELYKLLIATHDQTQGLNEEFKTHEDVHFQDKKKTIIESFEDSIGIITCFDISNVKKFLEIPENVNINKVDIKSISPVCLCIELTDADNIIHEFNISFDINSDSSRFGFSLFYKIMQYISDNLPEGDTKTLLQPYFGKELKEISYKDEIELIKKLLVYKVTGGKDAASNVKEITLTIKNYAHIRDKYFSPFTNLEKLTLKGDIERLDLDIFEDIFKVNPKLKTLSLENTTITKDGQNVVAECRTIDKDSLKFIQRFQTNVLDISNLNIQTIPADAFKKNKSLTSVKFGPSITCIDYGAFCSCKKIKELDFSNTNIKTIGDTAFMANKNLTSVKFGKNIESIGGGAFNYCDLRELDLSNTNIQTIGDYAFQDNKNLTSVKFGKSIKSIGIGAFWNCDLKELDLSNTNIKTIYPSTFTRISNLKQVKLNDNIEKIYENAFDEGVKFEYKGNQYTNIDDVIEAINEQNAQ